MTRPHRCANDAPERSSCAVVRVPFGQLALPARRMTWHRWSERWSRSTRAGFPDGRCAKHDPPHGAPDTRQAALGSHDVRREGSRHIVPADRAAPAPAGAPNVLVVLLDDVGFSASSAFGGPWSTPTAERLASRPSDHAGGAAAGRDGAAVASARGAAHAAPRNDEQWPRYRSVAPARVSAQITQTQSAITRIDQNG